METASRLVRVFISSTFRDCMGERDTLVKKVFPELKRRCKSLFVELVEVDLRWGVTEEQSKLGETLKICLQEIDRCRPSAPVFFIGILGERYGWIPPKDYYPSSVLNDPDLSWVKEHTGGKSLTELEIMHGVLNSRLAQANAFFYFRREGYHVRHWEKIHQTYPDLSAADFTNDADVDPAGSCQKQASLKQRIVDYGLLNPPRAYDDQAAFEALILNDLWGRIEELFPDYRVPDALEQQRMDHAAFAASRLKAYVPRPALLDALDAALKPHGPDPTIIIGASGLGKSSLLSHWLDQRSTILPVFTFLHFVGGTPESGTLENLLARLLGTLRNWGGIQDRVPEDLDQMISTLPLWLSHMANSRGSVLIVLDAINELARLSTHGLSWIPEVSGVRWILSTVPGPCEAEFIKRGWVSPAHFIEIPMLTMKERKEIINSHLMFFSKTLQDELVEKLAAAPQSGTALFLKAALEELRLRGTYETLQHLVECITQCKDPTELFLFILKNLEEHDAERRHLVRESLGFLGVARRGLTETELLQLLSDDDDPVTNPFPRRFWSPVFLALEGSLIERNGRLSLSHSFLRDAVNQEYLDEEWERRNVHGRFVALADRLCAGQSAGATLDHYLARFSCFHAGAIGGPSEYARLVIPFLPHNFEMLSHAESISLTAEACEVLAAEGDWPDDPIFSANVAMLLVHTRSPETARPLCRKLIRSGRDWHHAFPERGLDGRGSTYVFAAEWAAWVQTLQPDQAETEIEFLIEAMTDVDSSLGQAAVYAFKYVILADPQRFGVTLIERALTGWQENRLGITHILMQLAIDGTHLPEVDDLQTFWNAKWDYNEVELNMLRGALAFRNLPSRHADPHEADYFRHLDIRRSEIALTPHCFASKRLLDRFWTLGQTGESILDDMKSCLEEHSGFEVVVFLLEFPFWEVAARAAEVLANLMMTDDAVRLRIQNLALDVNGHAAYSAFFATSLWALRSEQIDAYFELLNASSRSNNCQVRGQAAESVMSFLRECKDAKLKDFFLRLVPVLHRLLHDGDIWPVQEVLHNLQDIDDELRAVQVDWRLLLQADSAPILRTVQSWETIGPNWTAFEAIARNGRASPTVSS